jgi:hypothetical protein
VPLIDGCGHTWYPKATDPEAIRDYTLGHQVVAPYDFTAAITNGLKEFAPEAIIILGPGTTLGGAVAQCLIANNWRSIDRKSHFISTQKTDPFVLSMGMDQQRTIVSAAQ